MNVGIVETSLTSSTISSRRRRGSKSTSNQPDRMKRRDIEFMHQTVSVVKKIGEFGSSYLYSAKDDPTKRRTSKGLLIKATVAATTEEARRAEAEIRLLGKLSGAPGIPTIIDCGFSTIEERVYDYDAGGDRLDVRRLYCILLEPCPDYFLTDFIKKRRRKYNKCSTLFMRKKKYEVWEGYLPIHTILDIFGQMASAISALHAFQDEIDSPNPPRSEANDDALRRPKKGIVHLGLQPSRFMLRKFKGKGKEVERFEVKLCSFGCSIRGFIPVTSDNDRDDAAKLIESSSSPMYRSPEMIDLHLTEELDASADIWGLGCCLYELLFLTECFKGHSKLDLLQGEFLLPAKHPYKRDVIDVLARMLTVNQSQRATIEEVQSCLISLKVGKPLPPRRTLTQQIEVEIEEDTDQMLNLTELSSRSDEPEGQATGELGLPPLTETAVHATLYTDDLAEGETTDSGESHESFGISADGASSDRTKMSQWVELRPCSSDGSHLEQRIAPLSDPTRIIQRGGLRRRRRGNGPLNLGVAASSSRKKEEKKQHLFSDRKLGLINQLSSRSLIPIDTDAPEVGSDSGEKDNGISPLPQPSLKKINPYGLALKTKDSPGVRRPYYPTKFLVSEPSLRVSDLIKDGVSRGVSTTSSSEMHFSSTNDHTSSEWQSSAEIPASNKLDVSSAELTMPTSDTSASFKHTPRTEPSSKKIISIAELITPGRQGELSPGESSNVQTPRSAPVRMGTFQKESILDRGVSPNIAPALRYQSAKMGKTSPRNFAVGSKSNALSSGKATIGALQLSDSQLETKKTKKSKSKSKKKAKAKRKSKNEEEHDVVVDAIHDIPVEQEGPGAVASTEEAEEIFRASATTIFSIPEFNPHPHGIDAGEDGVARDVDTAGNGLADVAERSFNRLGAWGNYSAPEVWAAVMQEEESPKIRKKYRKKKTWSDATRSLIADGMVELVEEKCSSSASDLAAWDLKAVEQWVTSKSQEASALSPPRKVKEELKATLENDKLDDPYHTKRDESSTPVEIPENWLTDAKQWVKKNSPTKVALLRQGTQKTLSNRSAKAEVGPAWFAKSKTSFLSSERQAKDAAGFPLPPTRGLAREQSENAPISRKLDRDSKPFKSSPLDQCFSTPQHKREKLQIPRSAMSTSEISKGETKGGRRLSHQTLDASIVQHFSPSRRDTMERTRSGLTQGSSKTLDSNKQTSVDSNMPPGDEVVVAEVSTPGDEMSVKEECHITFTAEDRKMKRPFDKMEEVSPHALLSPMLSRGKEPENMQQQSRSQPASPERITLEAKLNKSTGTMRIPSVIVLFTAQNESFPQAAVSSPNTFNNGRLTPDTTQPATTWSGPTPRQYPETHSGLKSLPSSTIADQPKTSAPQEMLPMAPILSPTTPGAVGSKKVKKKKKSKDRKSAKKSKSERIINLPENPSAAPLSNSLTEVMNLTESFAQNLAEVHSRRHDV